MKVTVEKEKLEDFYPKIVVFVQGIKLLKDCNPKAPIRMPQITGEIRIKIDPLEYPHPDTDKMKQLGFRYCESDKEWIY
jgi:hypothetical protein